MSTTYSSYAIIGHEIVEEKIPIIIKRKKGFDHNYIDDGSFEYDPKTGKKLWVEVRTPKYLFTNRHYDDHGELNWQQTDSSPEIKQDDPLFQVKVNLKGLAVFSDSEEEHLILGIGVSNDLGSNYADFRALNEENMKQIKERIQSVLEPIGLWDETKFGLYSILQIG